MLVLEELRHISISEPMPMSKPGPEAPRRIEVFMNVAPDATQNNAVTKTDRTRKNRTHAATLCHPKAMELAAVHE